MFVIIHGCHSHCFMWVCFQAGCHDYWRLTTSCWLPHPLSWLSLVTIMLVVMSRYGNNGFQGYRWDIWVTSCTPGGWTKLTAPGGSIYSPSKNNLCGRKIYGINDIGCFCILLHLFTYEGVKPENFGNFMWRIDIINTWIFITPSTWGHISLV